MPHIDPHAPFCDAILFNDLHNAPKSWADLLMARGLVYTTSLVINGRTFCGMIVAGSLTQAVEIAFGRGLGEIVTGQAVQIVPE